VKECRARFNAASIALAVFNLLGKKWARAKAVRDLMRDAEERIAANLASFESHLV
jgi:hypothetical protein